jgi:hypothetical protein
MGSDKPKITARDKKGKKISIGKGIKGMKLGETKSFRLSIDLPEEKPFKEKK